MSGARQVLDAQRSFHEELTNVIRAAVTVIMLAWIYLAATAGDTHDARRSLLPYQSLIQTRSLSDQRMFRELQEGLLEAEIVRTTDGRWPVPDTLAANGIPPFAFDPTTGMRYRWLLLEDRHIINYLGVPDRADAPAWLLVVQEPQPGIPPDQPFEDEEHHKLLNGAMLHVATWVRPDGARTPARVTISPQTEGWQQVYAVGPAANPAAIMLR